MDRWRRSIKYCRVVHRLPRRRSTRRPREIAYTSGVMSSGVCVCVCVVRCISCLTCAALAQVCVCVSSESLGPTKSFGLVTWACSLGLFIRYLLCKVSDGKYCFAGALVDSIHQVKFPFFLFVSPEKFVFVRQLPLDVNIS
jgi:hypothetical protein